VTNPNQHGYIENFFSLRQFEQAIAQLRRVLELEPDFYIPRALLGLVYAEKGFFDEAITELHLSIWKKLTKITLNGLPCSMFSLPLIA